jgi:hypothetical protein
MPRYYFNFKDGKTSLDQEGVELSGLSQARDMAIMHSGEILRDGASGALWAGESWHMWITDEPNGAGKTLLTLKFSATDSSETAVS